MPTKGIAPQRALLTVGAQILMSSERQSVTVTQAWRRLQKWRADHAHNAPVPFWWFVLALDVLYALGTVELRDDLLVFREVSGVA
ncbi:ABC-three component system middle component 6 [Nocardiopsis sp. Huas11]|uniref:ABC-three component system middle component 6 n=1 Tax=Nocardiopsis sp. Huas11 TaxID=2183912 RepID=UPI001F3C10F9|nr:ABC-three component system middle component 6 [Nocardiopsis sp. Huas11]